MNMSIAKKLKLLRKERGLTQKALSDLSGVPTITIQGYEAEKFNPKVGQIEKLAKALNVTPYDLAGPSYWDEKFDVKQLSEQVSAFDKVSILYGEDAAQMLENYSCLNAEGQKKAATYIEDLVEIPKYHA